MAVGSSEGLSTSKSSSATVSMNECTIGTYNTTLFSSQLGRVFRYETNTKPCVLAKHTPSLHSHSPPSSKQQPPPKPRIAQKPNSFYLRSSPVRETPRQNSSMVCRRWQMPFYDSQTARAQFHFLYLAHRALAKGKKCQLRSKGAEGAQSITLVTRKEKAGKAGDGCLYLPLTSVFLLQCVSCVTCLPVLVVFSCGFVWWRVCYQRSCAPIRHLVEQRC